MSSCLGVHAESLDANDHELVGIDHDQEAGGADEALCPNARVADGEADDTTEADVDLVRDAEGGVLEG